MPLQQISLDQSIYKKKDTNINRQQQQPSNGRQPKKTIFAGASNSSPIVDAGHDFLSAQKDKWAEEDKQLKEARDNEMQQAQEIGMRVRAGLEREKASAQQQAGQQQQQQAEIKAKIEANPEPAAQEMYNLMKTLPDDAKNQLLNQLFTPTSSGSSVSSGGKTVQVGGEKYNPLANVFLQKGWAMFDEKGQVNLSEPEREFEKGTFEIVEKGGKVYKLNTATNESIELGSTDEPENVVNEINKQANSDALALSKTGDVTFEDAKYDALIDNGVDKEVAADMAKVKEIPKDDKEKGIIEKFTDWFTGKKETSPETLGAPMKSLGKDTFNEANVTSLISVISDDVTPAERAHLVSQGATGADIDEAIKRKGSK